MKCPKAAEGVRNLQEASGRHNFKIIINKQTNYMALRATCNLSMFVDSIRQH